MQLHETRAPGINLRMKLLLISLVVCLPLIVYEISAIKTRYEHYMNLHTGSMEDMAKAVGMAFSNYVESVWNTEQIIAQTITKMNLSPKQATDIFKSMAATTPAVKSISWVNTEYEVVSDIRLQRKYRLPRRDYITRILRGEGKVISGVQPSVIDGEPIIVISSPIRKDGKLLGVINTIVDVAKLDEVLPSVRGATTAIGLVDADAMIVYRSGPNQLTWDNRLLKPDSPAREALSGRVATIRSYNASFNGELRSGSNIPVPEIAWAAFATMSLNEAMSLARYDAARSLVILLCLTAVSVCIAFTTSRRVVSGIETLGQMALAVSKGELPHHEQPSNQDELGKTIQAFNDMAHRLKEAEATRSRLIQMAAHELRNPIAGVKGIIGLLRLRIKRGKPSDELIPIIDIAEQELDRTTKFLNEFVDTFRIQQGRLELRCDSIDLAALLLRATEPYSLNEDLHSVVLNIDTSRVINVAGDSLRLEQVFSNLIGNSIKYSPHGGTVKISLTVSGCSAIVVIQDEGIGIPEDELPRIFDSFYRASNVVGNDPGGAGLGLYLCREVVELHGGRIWVESKEGEGTTFSVELPLSESAAVIAG